MWMSSKVRMQPDWMAERGDRRKGPSDGGGGEAAVDGGGWRSQGNVWV